MASTPSHQYLCPRQTIYNSISRKTEEAFSAFSRLPLCIRWAIWEQSLSYERLLHVKLYDPFPVVGSKDSGEGNSNYTLVLLGCHPISKLFRINLESRHIARRFYRVQLPCVYRCRRLDAHGTFYFNPELDILKLDFDWTTRDRASGVNVAPEHFAEIAHRIWTNDPRRVGIVNLALEGVYLGESNFDARLTKGSTICLLRDVLQRLKCVYFLSCAPFSLTWCTKVSGNNASQRTYPRVHPVMIYTSAFDRIPHDPRCVDLSAVYMGTSNPRETVEAWRKMLLRLQVTSDIDYRCMIARQITPFTEIRDPNTALDWVQEEDRKWHARISKRWGPDSTLSGGVQQESQTAFGFWLFPIECLRPDLDIDRDPAHPERYWEMHRVIDLSSFKPELCLFRL